MALDAKFSLRSRRFLLRGGVGLALATGLSLLPACTQPCLALAEKVCECKDGDLEQQNCKTQMKSAYDAARQSDLDANKQICSDLLDSCDCTKLDTEEGRAACGLAR